MKVLIAVDNSPFAGQVMDAVVRPWPADTEFLIVFVIERCSIPGSTESFLYQCQILMKDRVETLSKRLANHKVEGEVVEGSPQEQIVGAGIKFGADVDKSGTQSMILAYEQDAKK